MVPRDARLTARPPELPAWDGLTADQKRFATRQMEAYAGFMTHTDEQIGRLVDELQSSGECDNTLFIYIVGDNGASAEGGLSGSLNYLGKLMGFPEPESVLLAGIDRVGGPDANSHVNSAWAWAMDTPFQWTKTIASHLGATRNPMVITWPRRIAQGGGVRSQFGHVNDIVPTILEAAGIDAPAVVNGIAQKPINGVSLVYTFDDPHAPERHVTQYFEVFGHRSIYHEGWMASAFHTRLPWVAFDDSKVPFEQDRWELYDLVHDFSQSRDLAARHPERLDAMKRLFLQEAEANNALPLRTQAASSALPDLAGGVTSRTYHEETFAVPEPAVPHMANRSWSVQSSIEVTGAMRGVIAAIGGRPAGWALYIDAERRPTFSYRLYDLAAVTLRGEPLPPGPAALQVDLDYDGGGYAKGGALSLTVDGKRVATERLPATMPGFFSIHETFDVGVDSGTAAGDYPADGGVGYPFSGGTIGSVTIQLR